jgi:hypothetical protein
MSEIQNNELFERDAETNALIPVVHVRNEAGGGSLSLLIDILYVYGYIF